MIYKLAYWLFWPLFKLFYRIKFIGRDNMPNGGPVLLVSNHASYLDPVCLALASRRPVYFMAKEELFNYPLLKQVLPLLNAFSIRRGQSDRQALRLALNILEEDKVIGIFPQGTRIKSRDIGIGQKGAALLALKSGALVLPAAIEGTENVLPLGKHIPRFPQVKVVFGRPFRVVGREGESRGQIIENATVRIMASIAELLESR